MNNVPFPALADKFAVEPKMKRNGEYGWSILSSQLLGHLFFNVFGEKVPKKNVSEQKLPSMDSKATAKFKMEDSIVLAQAITEYRSNSRQLSSFENALEQTYEIKGQDNYATAFINLKAVEQDNVERIFTRAGESIPLNMDKVARNAFRASIEPTLDMRVFIGANPNNICHLPFSELEKYLGDDILIEWANKLRYDETHTFKEVITLALQPTEDLVKANSALMDILANRPVILIPARMWVSYDWSQAELYLLTLFSQSTSLYSALTSDDFHNTVATWALKGPNSFMTDEVPPEYREIAKTLTFAFVYSTFDVKVAAAIVKNKLPNLDSDLLAEAIERYAARIPDLMAWVDRHIARWGDLEANPTSTFNYAFGCAKYIERPIYLESGTLGSSKNGRVATNTMGQNSVGHLLKVVLASMRKDPILGTCGTAQVSQIIPVFDALYFTSNTIDLADTVASLSKHINCDLSLNPHLEGCMRDEYESTFSVRMRSDIKTSLDSWGAVSKRMTKVIYESTVRHYI